MKYIIRFNSKQEIRTYKICDFDTMLCLINDLEKDGVSYVVIKVNDGVQTISALLDYKYE